MSTAKEIMTPSPLMLGSGTDILEAVEFFNRHGITTTPVQNPLGEILGLLTEIDLVKALVHYRAKSDYSKVIHAQELFEPVFFVEETDDVATVLKAIIKAASHRVLVKDRKGKAIGIISPKDLLRSIQGGGNVSRAVVDEVRALQKQVGDLKSRMHEMSNYLKTYDTVFQSGEFGLHSADRAGKILFANDRLHKSLGYQRGELVGKTIYDIYPPEFHAEAKAGLKRVQDEGRHSLTFSSMIRKDGELLKVDLASAALKDETGRFVGTFTISRVHGTDAMATPADKVFET